MAVLMSPITIAIGIIFVSTGVATLLMLGLIKPRKENEQ